MFRILFFFKNNNGRRFYDGFTPTPVLLLNKTGVSSAKAERGFSLIELLVSISILTIISIVIFASYPEFNQRMAIRRTSNDIALTVREAQVYALSIKEFGEEFPAYGVNFEKNGGFTIFADLDNNNDYDKSNEALKSFTISTGDKISELYLCNDSPCSSPSVDEINVVYPRTKAMANIYGEGGGTSGSADYAIVTISAPNGKISKDIKIYLSGQISIE